MPASLGTHLEQVVEAVVVVGIACVSVGEQAVDIFPDEPLSAKSVIAFECTHADPHRTWVKELASKNMNWMVVTLDTFQLERLALNDVAP